MFRATAHVLTVLVFGILPSHGTADAPGAPLPILDIIQSGRPPNLFKLAYQRQEGLCESIGKELNTASEPGKNRGDYFGMLTTISGNAFWNWVGDDPGLHGSPVEFTLADIFNEGIARLVFRVQSSLGNRQFDVLHADPEADSNPGAALKRLVADGNFDQASLVPPQPLQAYYTAANLGHAADRNLLRFDLLRLGNVTYVVEGSFYEFAPFDAILFYVGRPDRKFVLECAFDPQTLIPASPPDL